MTGDNQTAEELYEEAVGRLLDAVNRTYSPEHLQLPESEVTPIVTRLRRHLASVRVDVYKGGMR